MNHIDQTISELAAAFCMLKKHDEKLYIKAMQSLVALVLSEEKLARASGIENDLQHVQRILFNTRRKRPMEDPNVSEFPCRRKNERRASSQY